MALPPLPHGPLDASRCQSRHTQSEAAEWGPCNSMAYRHGRPRVPCWRGPAASKRRSNVFRQGRENHVVIAIIDLTLPLASPAHDMDRRRSHPLQGPNHHCWAKREEHCKVRQSLGPPRRAQERGQQQRTHIGTTVPSAHPRAHPPAGRPARTAWLSAVQAQKVRYIRYTVQTQKVRYAVYGARYRQVSSETAADCAAPPVSTQLPLGPLGALPSAPPSS